LIWLNTNKRKLIKCFLIIIVLSGSLSFVYNQLAYTEQDEPVYFVDLFPINKIAFTFEILWEEEGLTEILEILEEKEVSATFFITGNWLEKNPEKAKRIVLKGNEIGNHTYSHPSLLKLAEADIYKEIASFAKIAQENLEYYPQVFRPPYGEYNNLVVEMAAQQNYSTVLWSINAKECTAENSNDIVNCLVPKLHDGAIINFEVSDSHMVQALPEIISSIRKEDYQIVTVSKLLKEKN